jgi:hypothetical protein
VPQIAHGKVQAILQKPFSAKSLLGILRQAAGRSENPPQAQQPMH